MNFSHSCLIEHMCRDQLLYCMCDLIVEYFVLFNSIKLHPYQLIVNFTNNVSLLSFVVKPRELIFGKNQL